MKLVNQYVSHDSFGQGQIVDQTETFIEVSFPCGKKKFVYPDAFGSFLILEDEQTADLVDDIKQEVKLERKLERKELEKQRAIEEEKRQQLLERERIMRDFKLSPAAQVVFWVDTDEQKEIFTDWQIFTGVRKSGANKGEPNRLVRLHQNSVCLVTVREPDQPEEERRIVGLFAVDEGFIGRLAEDGNIPAHPHYRFEFSDSQSEKLLFWNYYVNERYPRNMTWNSGRHRYFENIWMAQIIQDLIELKQDSVKLGLLEEFFEYFCQLNRLNPEEIPERNGVLQRLKAKK